MLRPTKTPLSDTLRQLVGQPADAIDTPALVVDLDAMQRNLSRMAEFARKHEIRWRPHAKMHKSSAIARLQMHAGAVGVCVQKTAEAEAMAAGGRARHLHQQRGDRPAQAGPGGRSWRTGWPRRTANSPSPSTAAKASAGWRHAMNEARRSSGTPAVIDVFVEIDVGQGRCGVPPGRSAVDLVHEIRQHPALRFVGPAGLPRAGAAPAQRAASGAR